MDGGRGSAAVAPLPVTRAFAGSKPLLIASLPASGHTVLTFIFGDGWLMGGIGCTMQDRQPESPSCTHVWYFALRSLGIVRRNLTRVKLIHVYTVYLY